MTSPAQTLANKDHQQLFDECDYLAWTISCEVEWMAQLLALLFRPDRGQQSHLHASANAFRRIRRRVDRLQVYVGAVRSMGHLTPKRGLKKMQ